MRHRPTIHPAPWIVAESVGLRLLRHAPKSLHLVGDPGGRVRRTIEDLVADPTMGLECELVKDPPADCVVWLGDGDLGERAARIGVAELGASCSGVLILAEPVLPGIGLGLSLMRSMDPNTLQITTEEVPDGIGGVRKRKPWEAVARWAVSEIFAWRFLPDAEIARDGLLHRLPALSGRALTGACERVIELWPHAHEVWVLAIQSAARRGLADDVLNLFERLRSTPGVGRGVLDAARNALFMAGVHPWMQAAVEAASNRPPRKAG